MMKYITLGLILFLVVNLFAQTPEEKAKAVQLCKSGIEEMDKGEIENAIVLFQQAQKLDPENIHYPYEVGHSYFLTRNYKKAIQTLEPLLDHQGLTDHVYNILGNSYEYSKNEEKARETYLAGLEKFPSSGILYHSLGNLTLNKQQYREALDYFEKGIQADPGFSSNYYWASKVHASLEDKLWGIIYAEIFINMEGVTEKSGELSRMIFDVYQNGIKTNGSSIMLDIADADTSGKNFEHDVETQLLSSTKKINKPLSIATLYQIREDFIYNWVKLGTHDKYPNYLFDWHKTLLLSGYLESYHYWLFREINPGEFEKYKNENEERYNKFVQWLSENYLKPDKSDFFIARQYSN